MEFDGLLRQYEMPPIHFYDTFDKLQEQLDILDRIMHDLKMKRKSLITKINTLSDKEVQQRAECLKNNLKAISVPSLDPYGLSLKTTILLEERMQLKKQIDLLTKTTIVDNLLKSLEGKISDKDLGEAEKKIKELESFELPLKAAEKAKELRKQYIQLVKEQLI